MLSGSPIVKRGHAVPFLLEPLQALALYDTELVPTLEWPADRRAAGRERLRALGVRDRPVAVHPGSGSPTKNWPAERFAEIVRRLRAAGRDAVAPLLDDSEPGFDGIFASSDAIAMGAIEALQAAATSCLRTIRPLLTAQNISVRMARLVRIVSRMNPPSI